jgi:hypothetical protein
MMDSEEFLEAWCEVRALAGSPLMTGAECRDELAIVVSIDAARTRKATRDLWRARGY